MRIGVNGPGGSSQGGEHKTPTAGSWNKFARSFQPDHQGTRKDVGNTPTRVILSEGFLPQTRWASVTSNPSWRRCSPNKRGLGIRRLRSRARIHRR